MLRTNLGKVRPESVLSEAGIDPPLSQIWVFGKSVIGYTLTLGAVTNSNCTHRMVPALVRVRVRHDLDFNPFERLLSFISNPKATFGNSDPKSCFLTNKRYSSKFNGTNSIVTEMKKKRL